MKSQTEKPIRNKFREQKGDGALYTIFLSACFMMFLSMAAAWIGTGAVVMNIRNAVKSELAAVSIRIEQDTYQALREGNLPAYEAKLNSSPAYHAELQQLVEDSIRENVPLQSETYKIENIKMEFTKEPEAVVYTLSCQVAFRISAIGIPGAVRTKELSFSGRHAIKFPP